MEENPLVRLELKKHLWRLIAVSGLCILIGTPLAFITSDPFAKGFWIMTAGWSLVNLAIAIPGLFGKKPIKTRVFREFISLNLGLNVAYISVGVCLAVMGDPGGKGTGWAIVIQGAILLVLDGWLLFKSPTEP